MLGGPALNLPGVRAVPSLTYLERQPKFSIGPDNDEDENARSCRWWRWPPGTQRAPKTAHDTRRSAPNLVPQGGLFWDGRADTLQEQALGRCSTRSRWTAAASPRRREVARTRPMRACSRSCSARRCSTGRAACGRRGAVRGRALSDRRTELPSLHQQVRLLAGGQGAAHARPRCAAICSSTIRTRPIAAAAIWTSRRRRPAAALHRPSVRGAGRAAQPRAGGQPRPGLFRSRHLRPDRTDIAEQTQYCGMFLTPTLRNVATRQVFFHNGVFSSLQQVMDFYNFRDTAPQKVYPRAADGTVAEIRRHPAASIAPTSTWPIRPSTAIRATRRR